MQFYENPIKLKLKSKIKNANTDMNISNIFNLDDNPEHLSTNSKQI